MKLNDKIEIRICYFSETGKYTKDKFIINNINDLEIHKSKILHDFSTVLVVCKGYNHLCFSVKPDMRICDSNGRILYSKDYTIKNLYDLIKNKYKFIKERIIWK